MSRIMDFKTLCGHLQKGRAETLQCRLRAHRFALDAEQLTDARWQISLHIAELEGLERDVLGQKLTRLELSTRNRLKAPPKIFREIRQPTEWPDNAQFARFGMQQEP